VNLLEYIPSYIFRDETNLAFLVNLLSGVYRSNVLLMYRVLKGNI